jgi:hypothetical protein
LQIVIAHAKRNNDLLERNLPYIRENIGHSSIVVLTEKGNAPNLPTASGESLRVLEEDSIMPGLSLAAVKAAFEGTAVPERRAGWYFQQFLKMAWSLREDCEEWYLVWDSDTFPLRPIALFDEAGKALFTSSNERNPAYFETIDLLLGPGRRADFSFISENMLINRAIMRELIGRIAGNEGIEGADFFDKILAAVKKSSDPYCAFSEFETYGNFAMSHRPELYCMTRRSSSRKGARRFGLKPSKRDLDRLSRRFDIVSFERWDRIVHPFVAINKLFSFVSAPRRARR